MNLNVRSYQKEWLDADHIPFEDIKLNMKELNTINTLLGGHAITINGFAKLLGKSNKVTVCEIGCGGGDNLAAIVKWCSKKNITVDCIGIDMKPECIDVAKNNEHLTDNTQWIVSDYAKVVFETKPDIIFSSLFCHHFTESELLQQLNWMQTNSQLGFFINDLHRNLIAYHSIKLLTQLFSNSYLVKNDAPISVTRGFLINEWKELFKKAGIEKMTIQWKWAFRHLIIFMHGR